MTREKIESVVQMYITRLGGGGVTPVRINTGRTFGSLTMREMLAHAYYLCNGVIKLLDNHEKNRDKINRHLGFIQACLSFAGWYTLDQLRNHNRPDVVKQGGSNEKDL